jgi:diphthine-ammonia ligase
MKLPTPLFGAQPNAAISANNLTSSLPGKSGLKFIALISGGKDSLFSILHCIQNGHECVALANLYPPDAQHDETGKQIENEQDTDSYMYQTVGHSVIPLYEDALGIPLYRRAISGTAIDQSLTYTPRIGESSPATSHTQFDEAEDMFLLLKDVLDKHPDAQAVSSGAILSTYQRARVESVVIRLGLVPLSYLWQYPYIRSDNDESLLEDMREVQQVSKIVKVASGGLDELFLGRDVTDRITILQLRLNMSKFNPEVGAILGEGGEFETLAMEGPKPLWKKRIVVKKQKIIRPGGGSFALHLSDIRTEDYQPLERRGDISSIRIPVVLPSFSLPLSTKVLEFIFKEQTYFLPKVTPLYSSNSLFTDIGFRTTGNVKYTAVEHGHCLRISNIIGKGETIEQQMEAIVAFVKDWLLFLYNLTPSSIIFTTLLLRKMSDFQSINTIYSRLFTESLPPARVTIAIGDLLPSGKHVSLSLAVQGSKSMKRDGLHVQSRSYWAPANIGPYSQAIVEQLIPLPGIEGSTFPISNLVHLAGQIPLVPATMEILDAQDTEKLLHDTPCDIFHQSSVTPKAIQRAQISLALQNLLKVTTAMNLEIGDLTAGVAFFSELSWSLAQEAALLWRTCVHSRATTVLSKPLPAGAQNILTGIKEKTNDSYLKALSKPPPPPDGQSQDSAASPFHATLPYPPCLCIFVSELPRGALVEWWSIGVTGGLKTSDVATRSNNAYLYRRISATTGVMVTWILVYHISALEELAREVAEFSWTKQALQGQDESDDEEPSIGTGPLLTVFAAAEIDKSWVRKWKPTLIPCNRIVEGGERQLDAVILVVYYPVTSLS